jgi:hypothetical protein
LTRFQSSAIGSRGSFVAGSLQGKIELDVRDSSPDWEVFGEPRAPEGAPNVLYVVWDDTGYVRSTSTVA